MRLARLVTSTLSDCTPGGTGRRSESTGSRMYQSELTCRNPRVHSMASPGTSVAAYPSITGHPKASVTVWRIAGVNNSPAHRMFTGVIRSRPARCSAASSTNTLG